MATWHLDPEITHLNHGSFGATPIEVLATQAELRHEMELNPVHFMTRRYQPLLERARADVATFVGADPDGLVFVPNATYGINSVLRSLESQIPAGSEIVITNHTYNACRNAAAETARRCGARLVVADIPFPVSDAGEIAAAVLEAVSPNAALVLLDHVTSATGLVLPLRDLVSQLEPIVPVLVDGAHAPGMIDLDVASLGASFYTANCHKWMCAPKGAAFLWVDERHRAAIRAAAISHGYNDEWPNSGSRFHAQFDWTGTDDPTARLCVPAALTVMGEHHAKGWSGLQHSNHELLLRGRDVIAEVLQIDQPAPDDLLGSLGSLPLPASYNHHSALEITEALHAQFGIEVPVVTWTGPALRLLRISAQQYNQISDYEKLAVALRSLA